MQHIRHSTRALSHLSSMHRCCASIAHAASCGAAAPSAAGSGGKGAPGGTSSPGGGRCGWVTARRQLLPPQHFLHPLSPARGPAVPPLGHRPTPHAHHRCPALPAVLQGMGAPPGTAAPHLRRPAVPAVTFADFSSLQRSATRQRGRAGRPSPRERAEAAAAPGSTAQPWSWARPGRHRARFAPSCFPVNCTGCADGAGTDNAGLLSPLAPPRQRSPHQRRPGSEALAPGSGCGLPSCPACGEITGASFITSSLPFLLNIIPLQPSRSQPRGKAAVSLRMAGAHGEGMRHQALRSEAGLSRGLPGAPPVPISHRSGVLPFLARFHHPQRAVALTGLHTPHHPS